MCTGLASGWKKSVNSIFGERGCGTGAAAAGSIRWQGRPDIKVKNSRCLYSGCFCADSNVAKV